MHTMKKLIILLLFFSVSLNGQNDLFYEIEWPTEKGDIQLYLLTEKGAKELLNETTENPQINTEFSDFINWIKSAKTVGDIKKKDGKTIGKNELIRLAGLAPNDQINLIPENYRNPNFRPIAKVAEIRQFWLDNKDLF